MNKDVHEIFLSILYKNLSLSKKNIELSDWQAQMVKNNKGNRLLYFKNNRFVYHRLKNKFFKAVRRKLSLNNLVHGNSFSYKNKSILFDFNHRLVGSKESYFFDPYSPLIIDEICDNFKNKGEVKNFKENIKLRNYILSLNNSLADLIQNKNSEDARLKVEENFKSLFEKLSKVSLSKNSKNEILIKMIETACFQYKTHSVSDIYSLADVKHRDMLIEAIDKVFSKQYIRINHLSNKEKYTKHIQKEIEFSNNQLINFIKVINNFIEKEEFKKKSSNKKNSSKLRQFLQKIYKKLKISKKYKISFKLKSRLGNMIKSSKTLLKKKIIPTKQSKVSKSKLKSSVEVKPREKPKGFK